MDGKRVFKFTLDELPGAINKTLLANNIKSIIEIDTWIFNKSGVNFPKCWPLDAGIGDFWPEFRIPLQKLYI